MTSATFCLPEEVVTVENRMKMSGIPSESILSLKLTFILKIYYALQGLCPFHPFREVFGVFAMDIPTELWNKYVMDWCGTHESVKTLYEEKENKDG